MRANNARARPASTGRPVAWLWQKRPRISPVHLPLAPIRLLSCVVCLLLAARTTAAMDAVTLPKTLAWTAYNLGTTGYNQSVAIGKVLKDRYGVALRVIPGKNDISRLLPLKAGRVQFSANGVATYFAQEGVFQFASRKWGPMPIRIVMMSNGLANQAVAVAADTGVTEIAGLRGKRIPWVRGAPAINVSTEAMLACGGLGWDDVIRVEFPGYNSMWNGIVNDQIDAAYATTVSGPTKKLEASPRGILWPTIAHDDDACWQRMTAIAPYFTRHIAVRGTAISEAKPHEGATYPYPILIVLADQRPAMTYSMARVIDEEYESYKDADPGSVGWALTSQRFDWVVPYHDGAVRYFRHRGVWTDEYEFHNQALIERQRVLQAAWEDALEAVDGADAAFEASWLKLRVERLLEAGYDPIWR